MDINHPKFELSCIGRQVSWPSYTAMFSLKNVSRIAASNISCMSFELIFHDNEKKWIIVNSDEFPTSIMPYKEEKFSINSYLFAGREIGYKYFELRIRAEDEASNSFIYLARKNVDNPQSSKYIEGKWDIEAVKTELNDGSIIDYSSISTLSSSVKNALEDANILIHEGRYSSAVDRIHTAFHGYLKQLLDGYSCLYDENESIAGCLKNYAVSMKVLFNHRK